MFDEIKESETDYEVIGMDVAESASWVVVQSPNQSIPCECVPEYGVRCRQHMW